MSGSASESGSATVLAVVSAGLSVGLATLLAALVLAMAMRVEIETAADAAALAAVGAAVTGDDPCAAAGRLAAANGSRLTRCHCPDYIGSPLVATVAVAGVIDIPLVGERTVEVTRSAEYRPGT